MSSIIDQNQPSQEGEASRAPTAIKPSQPTEPTHVDLKDLYYKSSMWTNDPKELDLDTYFHPLRPNLGRDFDIPGLRPVIKESTQEDFLLMDDNKRFYTWNPNDGRLFRVKREGLQPSDAADLAMNGFAQEDLEITVHGPYGERGL